MAVVFFLLDAFRFDYLSAEDTPFLWQCAQDGRHIQRIVPNFGFCERSEILTGQRPDVTGFFTAIGYDPEHSPFKRLTWLLAILPPWERLLPKNRFYRAYRARLNRWVSRRNSQRMNPYHIPLTLLPYWSLTEDQIDHRKPGAFPVPSIFQLMTEQGKTYFYDSFTALNLPANGPDHNRQRLAIEAARQHNYALYLVFVSLPDVLGHRYGPHSRQLRQGLTEMDRDLQKFILTFETIHPESHYIFLGDHGMVGVKCYLDVEKVINKIARQKRLKLGHDFVYFLDSTLMRLWTFSDKVQTIFSEQLQNNTLLSQNGQFINKELAKAYHIPWNDRRYGDIIWWAHPGTLIFPDFFHQVEKKKGMHGYDPTLPESQGMCIACGPGIAQQKVDMMHLTDVFHLLREIVEI